MAIKHTPLKRLFTVYYQEKHFRFVKTPIGGEGT